MTQLDIRRPMADLPIHEYPLIEILPARDVWADGIVDPVEIVGNGTSFRTTFFALMKFDGEWARVPVIRVVRAVTAYRRNQLGDMLVRQQRTAESPLIVN